MKLSDLDVYFMTDQPEECHKCGTRTDFIETGEQQLHVCLNKDCREIFVLEEKSE